MASVSPLPLPSSLSLPGASTMMVMTASIVSITLTKVTLWFLLLSLLFFATAPLPPSHDLLHRHKKKMSVRRASSEKARSTNFPSPRAYSPSLRSYRGSPHRKPSSTIRKPSTGKVFVHAKLLKVLRSGSFGSWLRGPGPFGSRPEAVKAALSRPSFCSLF